MEACLVEIMGEVLSQMGDNDPIQTFSHAPAIVILI